MQKTFKITLSGQVQGVGFRPFVHGLAQGHQYKGTVCNNELGVLIHINTTKENAEIFLKEVLDKAPSIAVIQSYSLKETAFVVYPDFSIVNSEKRHQINIPLTPDFGICVSCRNEIVDKDNRRFQYPFTTCVNCGPRYAITTKFPFERPHTTMAKYTMCAHCTEEYSNPQDQRFHSQTNSCPDCGIQLKLTDAKGKMISGSQAELIKKVVTALAHGKIVALKNTNGYLLCCDAQNKKAVQKLRKKKKRPTKPFALLYPTLEFVEQHFVLDPNAKKALTSSVAPIVILRPNTSIQHLAISDIAPGLDQLGIMLPSSALLTLIMQELKTPMVATSGNIHGSPIISNEKDAVEKLKDVSDFFLHHDLEISFPQDDSVLKFSGGQQITLRRSRGLAPNYLEYDTITDEPILAMGAHLKSTFTYTPNAHTYVSPYFGNLDNYDVLERYSQSIEQYTQLFEKRPETILMDLHPQYQSNILGRELAKTRRTKCVPIQHHKAHFASVLGEHGMFPTKEKILGVVWDGTGLGEDRSIWGGEFFIYQNHRIGRLTHFEPFNWLAGDKMSTEPRLSLLGILSEEHNSIAREKFSATEWKIYTKMLQTNTLKTSSVGRLFDAVASLLGIKDYSTYEGEAAMLLENYALQYKGNTYINFLADETYDTVPTKVFIQNILKARLNGIPKEQIAHSFIHTLAMVILKVAQQHNFTCIACSGGVFQNAVLVNKLLLLTQKAKIDLKFNRILSSNDENISFGQLCYYQHIKN
ncbi:MAG: carbamoyltransferase HypF [Saonia sp.]